MCRSAGGLPELTGIMSSVSTEYGSVSGADACYVWNVWSRFDTSGTSVDAIGGWVRGAWCKV